MKISVVTPSYNQGQFIQRTIQSVASQTGCEIEHVVYDGASSDNTIDILKNSLSLKHWISEPDKGQTDAVNKGISATNGDIIGWLNSDDIYYPNALATVVQYFEAHPEVDVVYGMADHIDINDKILEAYPTEPWSFERLKETCFICQPALFFRRKVITQYGLLETSLKYCMDYEYWLRLGKAKVKISYLETKLAGSRLYAENKTLGSRVKVHKEINNMFKKKFGQVPNKWLFNYAHVRAEVKTHRNKSPKVFLLKLLLWSVAATIYWNRKMTKEFQNTLLCWLKN